MPENLELVGLCSKFKIHGEQQIDVIRSFLIRLVVRILTTWLGLQISPCASFDKQPASVTDLSFPSTFYLALPVGIPADLWGKLIPESNPVTAEKIALGQQLYFDKRLSLDGTMSCATCHDPATGYADRHAVAVGLQGKLGTRNAPTILNAIFQPLQFWDGRAHSLEEQAKQPLLNPSEMGMKDQEAVVARVSSLPEYSAAFRRVFRAEGITFDTIAKAIAAFERSQLSGNAPFDRFIAGNQKGHR